jgi:hypothetical protein
MTPTPAHKWTLYYMNVAIGRESLLDKLPQQHSDLTRDVDFPKIVEVFLCIPWQSLWYREWTENLPEGSGDHEMLSWAAFKHTLSISRIRFHNLTRSARLNTQWNWMWFMQRKPLVHRHGKRSWESVLEGCRSLPPIHPQPCLPFDPDVFPPKQKRFFAFWVEF